MPGRRGCHLSCFIVAGDGRRLGCLLFQRASNRLRRRDEWIGWDGRRFNRRLERVVCNSRFLILPRVRAENLASHALSLSAARLADDWQARWQVRPALVETFVDGRIREGASCRAAGWEHAGRSAGDRSKGKAPKDVYLKALQADARAVLRHERRTRKKKAAALAQAAADGRVRRAVARLCRHRGRDGRGPRCRLAGAAAHDRHAAGGAVRVPAFSHNRQSYQITLNELRDQCRLLGVPLPQEHPAAASAMCAARMKVGAEAFAECRRRIVERLGDEQVERWRGRRLFAVDGAKINVPRELLEDGCSLPSPGARYPQGLCSCLQRPDDRMPIDFELSARLCERSLAATHLPRLSAGDVAACDRGCCPFELLWDHVRRNVDCANRLQRSSAAQFERFIESGESECIVRALPGKDARRKWRRSHPGEPPPQPVAVRCARIETGGEDFFIAATPADAERLPLPAIGDIYRGRWGIEELYKVSKQLAEVEQLRARTGRGVRQELFAHSAIVALTRSLGNFAEQAVGACADDGAAVQANFKNALATVARQLEAAVLGHARLAAEAVSNMVEGIASCISKTRPGTVVSESVEAPRRPLPQPEPQIRQGGAAGSVAAGRPAERCAFLSECTLFLK